MAVVFVISGNGVATEELSDDVCVVGRDDVSADDVGKAAIVEFDKDGIGVELKPNTGGGM